ncbi:MAG: Flp family type IVb pilin [Pseudomonadota bacterium]
MVREIKRFLSCEDGATAIEYGLIASFIALALIVGARQIGLNLADIFNNVVNYLR